MYNINAAVCTEGVHGNGHSSWDAIERYVCDGVT